MTPGILPDLWQIVSGNLTEEVYLDSTWNQDGDFCSPTTIDMISEIKHAVFLSSSKVRNIIACESSHGIAQVGNESFTRHGQLCVIQLRS